MHGGFVSGLTATAVLPFGRTSLNTTMVMNRRVTRVLVSAAGLLVLVLLLWGTLLVVVGRNGFEMRSTRDMLLNKVNHSATLEACHGLMSTLPGESLLGDDLRLPREISNLQPTYVVVDSEYVRIEFGGGFHHQGLLALSENADLEQYAAGGGTQELIDRLWFYEDTE